MEHHEIIKMKLVTIEKFKKNIKTNQYSLNEKQLKAIEYELLQNEENIDYLYGLIIGVFIGFIEL